MKYAIFKQRSTVFIVCLSAVGSIVWHSAINFNFRLYSMFPLIVYVILKFFEKQKIGYLWLAGIACLIGGMGVTIYFFGLWAFIYFVLVVMLLFKNKSSFKNIFKISKKNIFLFFSFITLVALALLYIKSSINFVTLVSKERATSGANTIATFLSYGRIDFAGYYFS